jgi:hypothetical protein
MTRRTKMARKTAVSTMVSGFACLAVLSIAMAGPKHNDCDVVTLNGEGTRLESGVIVGSEILTIAETGEAIPVEFTAVPLGVTDIDAEQTTFTSSHEFEAINKREIHFTTFDEVTTVPLGEDPSCGSTPCGLVFKLVLETGAGEYTCGQIVSGYDPTADPQQPAFTSTLLGDTLTLNSVGKLCKCRLSGNN